MKRFNQYIKEELGEESLTDFYKSKLEPIFQELFDFFQIDKVDKMYRNEDDWYFGN